MSRIQLIKAGSLVAVLALGAAACGGSSTPKATPSTGVAPAYNAALASVVNPSKKTGGTINYVASSDFDSLDPARTYYAYSWDFQRIYQRTVLMFKPVPGKDGTSVTGDLAEGPGAVSDGGKTVTYTLRDGITFQDGTAITSADIKYALERSFAQDVINGGPGATYLGPVIVGGDTYKGPYKDKTGLKGVDATDPKKLVVHLTKPFADFDYLMALPISTPVPVKADTGKNGGANYQFHVVSSGPYKIEKYSPGKLLTLVRNTAWKKESDPNRLALPDKIILTEGLDSADEDQRVLSGSADMEIEGTGVQQDAQSKILTQLDNKAQADNPATGFTRYITIQQTVAPFDNVHCRRAVQYAADKVSLQFSRGGPIAGGDIATQMTPPNMSSYQKINPYPSGSDNKGDLAKAKDELQQCGKPNGFSTKIATSNKGKGPKTAEALQQGLKRVGINAQIVPFDPSTYYSGIIGLPSNVKKQGLGLAVAGWGPDFPTPYGFFESIVDGRAIKPAGGNSNYAELNDPAINALIDQAQAETDSSKRNEIWAEVDKKVMDAAVYLPFVADKALTFRSKRLTNVYIGQYAGIYDFVNIGVAS